MNVGPEQNSKLAYIVDLLKWFIVSVALVVATMVVNFKFKDREAGISEISEYGKYVTNLIILNEDIGPRYRLSEYFAHVTVSENLRERWKDYYKTVKIQYDEKTREKEILEKKKAELLSKAGTLDDEQKSQLNKIDDTIDKIEQTLSAPVVSTANNQPSDWYVIASSDKSFEAALDEVKKAAAHIQDVTVFFKRQRYRSLLGPYVDRQSAMNALEIAKTSIRSDSYIIRLSTWCPKYEEIKDPGYFKCVE